LDGYCQNTPQGSLQKLILRKARNQVLNSIRETKIYTANQKHSTFKPRTLKAKVMFDKIVKNIDYILYEDVVCDSLLCPLN